MINKVLSSQVFGKTMSKGKIPDRWIPYTACGNVIEGTKIICFKVPLEKKVQGRVAGIKKIWDIPTLLREIPKLGAVIDLTNTARYYNPRDFDAANVIHRKILMPGREIPPESKVQQFMDAVDEFLGKDCDALIGVHCTHGLNRTGYMVCRYMRDRLDIPAKDAIKRFEKARGYKIERQIYINDLLGKNTPQTYHGKETDIITVDNRKELVEYVPTEDDNDNNTYNGNYNNQRSWRNRTRDQPITDLIGYTRNIGGRNDASSKDRDTYLAWRMRDGSSHSGQSSQSSWRNKNRSKKKDNEYSDRSYNYAFDY